MEDLSSLLQELISQTPSIPQGDPLLEADTSQLKAAGRAALAGHAPDSEPCPDVNPPACPDWLSGLNCRPVDVRQAQDLSEAQFLQEYMAPNKPVLIQCCAGCLGGWRAMHEWVTAGGQPNVQALLAAVGADAPVSVTDTGRQQSGSGTCFDTTLGEYINWWTSGRQQQQQQQVQQHAQEPPAACLPPGHWYLKDWHFVAATGPDYQAYQVPPYFSSDWLNEYYDRLNPPPPPPPPGGSHAHQEQQHSGTDCTGEAGRDQQQQQQDPAAELPASGQQAPGTRCADYRFVYLGPAGSWTPLHSDVLRSYSWSANIAGRKLWFLLPPQHTYLAYDLNMTMLAPEWGLPDTCFTHPDFPGQPPVQRPLHQDPHLAARFPNLHKAHQHLYCVVQEPGETLFVPSGWHHTVTNLTDTLSINHNWLNGHNIHWCWHLVQATHSRAKVSIADCRELCSTAGEWWELVQRMVQADCGLDLRGLAHLCADIMARAMQHISTRSSTPLSPHSEPGAAGEPDSGPCVQGGALGAQHRQQVLDLKRAAAVLTELVAVMEEQDLDTGATRQMTMSLGESRLDQLVGLVKHGDARDCIDSCYGLLLMACKLLPC